MGSTTIHSGRYRKFANLLRTWRTEAGLTQRELATKLKKPPSYVHKCEVAERKLDPLELIDWWKACGVDATDGLRQILNP